MPFVDLHCDTIARLLACRRAGAARSASDRGRGPCYLGKTPAERIPAPELCPVCQFAGGDAAPWGRGRCRGPLPPVHGLPGGVAVGGGFDPGGPLLDGDGGQRGPGCAGSVLSGDGAGPAGGKDCLPADRGGGGRLPGVPSAAADPLPAGGADAHPHLELSQ